MGQAALNYFEEGWSEISHKLVYKQEIGNQGLKKTSDVLSSMVGACDTIGMLMKTLYDTGIQSDGNTLGKGELLLILINCQLYIVQYMVGLRVEGAHKCNSLKNIWKKHLKSCILSL